MTKIINGFSNYSISEDGVITNVKTQQIKKPWLGKVGYYYVDLYANNSSTKVAIHRLLALHFIPNPENKRTVNHIDGNKLNNSLDNLEWATDAENIQHAFDNGLNSGNKLINDSDYETILKRFFKGESLTSIVEDYEFSLPTFSTYIENYVTTHNLKEQYVKEKEKQKLKRASSNGESRRKQIILQMLDKTTNEVLQTFNSVSEAKHFLNKKSCGPISNVIAGRAKSAYGYHWRKL